MKKLNDIERAAKKLETTIEAKFSRTIDLEMALGKRGLDQLEKLLALCKDINNGNAKKDGNSGNC